MIHVRKIKLDSHTGSVGINELFIRFGFGKSPSHVISFLTYWALMLIFFVTAARILNLSVISEILQRFVDFLPNLVAAIFQLEQPHTLEAVQRIVAEVEGATRGPEYATVRRVIAIWLRAALRRNRKSPILLPELDDLQELKIMLSQRIEKWAKEFEAEGEKKGRMEGRMEGEVRMLERQLTRRFGELPSWIRQRLSSASEAQLEHWSEAVLDAESLTAIFGEPPSRH